MVLVTYENCQIVYMQNSFNKMYNATKVTGANHADQDTGWHFIPNQLYKNWLTPRQWFDLVTNHDKFKLHSCECTVQNMIPLTDNLAIGQDTTFMTFNNTIYALGYTDKHYETFLTTHPMTCLWKEGAVLKQTDGTVDSKMSLPTYNHKLATDAGNTSYFKVYAWDPFIHPSSLMELRPGKNAIKFSWIADAVDNDKWYNTDIVQLSVDAYTGIVNKDSNNSSFGGEVMTPGQLVKEDPRTGYKKNAVVLYHKQWRYPITNWFIKMVPIMDSKNNLLKHEAQVVLVRKITFEVTPRTNTTNYPQLQFNYADTSKFYIGYAADVPDTWTLALRPSDNQGQWPPQGQMDTSQVIPNMPAQSTKKDKDKDKLSILHQKMLH